MRKILLTLSLLLVLSGCSLQSNDIQGYSSVSAPTIWKVLANKIQSVSTNWDLMEDKVWGGVTSTDSLTLYSNLNKDGLINLGDNVRVHETDQQLQLGIDPYSLGLEDPQASLMDIGNVDGYRAWNLYNISTSTVASTDILALNDNNDYVDVGINSSYNTDPVFALFDPGSAYLFTKNNPIYIATGGTTTSTGNIYFAAGGTASKNNISGVFTSDNKFGVGQAKADQDIDVAGHLSFQTIADPSGSFTLATSTGGSVDVGLHNYRIAYVAPVGETALSTSIVGITVANTTDDKVLISNIPQSTDKRVTQIRIYRTKLASSVLYYLVGTINTGVTTYTDTATDASLGTTLWNFKENATAGRIYLNGTIGAGRFGVQSTALGRLALNSLVNGRANLALGNAALRFCTECEFNTGIGSTALTANISGDSNVGVGAATLEALTTGSNNIAVGYQAVRASISGSFGIGIGASALYSSLSHTGAIAIGYQALLSSVTSTGNTVIGYQSGYAPNGLTANTTVSGINNTFIGYRTGQANSSTIDKSIAIGYNAVVGASSTFAVGGTGSDAVDVVIGGTTANSVLQVVGSLSLPYVAKTANYTLTKADYTVNCTTSTFTITLPTAVGITGRIYNIKNSGTGIITVDGNASETIDGELTMILSPGISGAYPNMQIQSTGSNWIIL